MLGRAFVIIGWALVALLGAMLFLSRGGAETFTARDEILIRRDHPDGRLINDGQAYRTCESGGWVYYYPNGRRLFTNEGCWR